METPQYSWAFETRFHRGKQWYMIAVTLILTLILMSFLLGAYPLGIVGILFVGVYLLYDINTPDMTRVDITTSGILINNELYSYPKIREFGIIRITEGPTILRIVVKNHMINNLDVFMDPKMDIEEIRLFLSTAIPENPQIRFSVIERILLGLRL
jgi:hypothetical protein